MDGKRYSAKELRMMEEEKYEQEIADAAYERELINRMYEEYEKERYEQYYADLERP